MRQAIRFGWAAAVGLAVGGTAVGQTTGSGTGSGTGSTGTGSSGGTTGGATSNAGGGSAVSGSLASSAPITAQDTSSGTAATTSALDTSNIFNQYYANPYYQGRAGATNTTVPGGFGTTLYNSGGSGGGIGTGTGGSSRTSTGTTGRTGSTTNQFTSATNQFTSSTSTGGRGGIGGTTGIGGTSGSNTSAQVIALPRPIAYTAVVRFATAPMTAPRMQSEARGVLDRSVSLSNPRGIAVVTDGQVVVLRGAVKDEDEARLAEGMIRLTPGVRDVRNELTFPGPVAAAGP